ncbi:MAG: hypothetical protein AB8B97_23865 [Granulosicoccus sp.]
MGKSSHDTIREVTEQGLDAVEDKVMDGLDATRKAVEGAADQSAELKAKSEAAVQELSQTVATYVQEKPLQAAGFAFAAGVVATLLLTRR